MAETTTLGTDWLNTHCRQSIISFVKVDAVGINISAIVPFLLALYDSEGSMYSITHLFFFKK